MYTYSYKHYRKRLQSQTDDDVLIREPSSYDDSNRTTSPLPHPNDENYLKSVSSRKINDDDDDVYVVVSRPLRRRRQREMSIMQQQQEQFVDHDNDDDEHDPTGNFGATANAFSSLEALLLTEPSHGHQQDYQANTATSTCLEITSAATTTTTTTTRSLESVGEPTHRGADDGFFSHGNITCDVEAGVGGDFPLSPSRIVPAMSQQQTVTTTIRREAPLPAKPAHHAIEGCTKRTEKLDMSINLRRKVRENNTLRQKLSAVTNQNAVLTDNSSQRHSINDHPTMKKKLATTVTRAAKSIVGSRPKHWSVTTLLSQRRDQPTAFLQASRQKRKAELAAALARPTAKVKTTSMQRLSSSLATKALRPARTGDQQPDNHIETQFTRTNPVSFAPAFFSVGKRHLGPINEPIGDIDATPLLPEVSVVMSPSSSSRAVGAWQRQPQQTAAFSPVPSKKSKSAVGPLAKRLKSLRDGIKGDSIRFSSGQYPFSIRSVNRNDPRNRADSVCNVTILGSLFPWDNQVRGELSSTHQQSQLRLMTALSYVHNWTSPTAGTLRTEQLDIDKEQGEIGVAWIVFSYDTAREHNLTAGSQIRVYNAVSIPFAPSVLRANDVTGSNADEMKVNVSINRIVLCSQLCEIYPSAILPPLPDVSSVWVSLQATQSPRT